MGFFARLLGICQTSFPGDTKSWKYSSGKVEIDLEKIPELSSPGTAVRLEGKGLSQRILLLHGKDGNFYAFENRCTHMGRRLDPLANMEAVQCCSISKSTFDYTGNVLSGMAQNALKRFSVKLEEGQMMILLD